jgi:hypothetical protein
MTTFALSCTTNPRSTEEPYPGVSNLRMLALLAGVALIAWEVLPTPVRVPVVLLLPVIYGVARGHARLVLAMSTVSIATVPSLIGSASYEVELRNVTLLALTPLYLRLLTWRDRTGLWDFLDPLVMFTAPISFVTLPILVAMLFNATALIGV